MQTSKITLRNIRSLLVAALLALSVLAFAMPQVGYAQLAKSPTSKPAPIKPTPEQSALIKKIASEPTDAPSARTDLRLSKSDGTPNENFGKPEPSWFSKHEEFLKRGKSGPIDLLFLGDSITDFWSSGGKAVWKERYGKMKPANFGISGDRTQHVLWRIENGELEGISPKVVVFMLGTNNTNGTADQILAGDTKIVREIHEKLPGTKVLLLGIFPRGADLTKKDVKGVRDKLKLVNVGLAKLDDGNKTRYLDIGDKFLAADGSIPSDVMPDGTHPSAKGYQIWADSMQPLLDEMMK